jgi:2-polyprenyl-6-hydroxyphenyl methylase/3-demethylubiquinone-9 3-methyltransferase
LEHVQDVEKVLIEVHRVLRPQGIFFFDTVNRNWLSHFIVITLAENVLKALPQGAHDAAKFKRPKELQRQLESNGFAVKPDTFMGRGLWGSIVAWTWFSACRPYTGPCTWDMRLQIES